MGCLFRDYDAVTHASTSLTMYSQHMRRLERSTVLMTDVQQELWVRIGKWGKENDVYAWP